MTNAGIINAISTSNLYMAVSIGGSSYPVIPRRGVQFMVVDNVKQSMATYLLIIDDVSKQLSNSKILADGVDIQVVVGTSQSLATTYNFVCFGKPARIKSDQIPGANTFVIQGISPAVAMATARPQEPIKGTSNDVMNAAASKFNLNVISNFNSNDYMTWHQSNTSWVDYLFNTVSHAWEDLNSVASSYIDSQNNLHFNNINRSIKVSAKAYIYQNRNNVYTISPSYPSVWYKFISRAGQENHKALYGMNTTQPNLDGTTTIHNQVSATFITQSVDVNKVTKNTVDVSPKVMFSPVDCGNTHSNFVTARHQNMKLKAVFNQDVLVGVPTYTGLNVYDTVVFSSTDSTGQIEKDITGKYLVSAINRFVSDSFYYEKIELTTSGLYTGSSELI